MEFNFIIINTLYNKANSKSRRFLKNDIQSTDLFNVTVKEDSQLAKYVNTYSLLADAKENSSNGRAILTRNGIEPDEYKILPQFNDLINAMIIKMPSASVLQTPIFKYQLTIPEEYMTPAEFNAYQDQFKQIGDENLFSSVAPVHFEDKTLSDVAYVTDNDGSDVLLVNDGGTISKHVSVLLGLTLPMSDLANYCVSAGEMDDKEALVCLLK